MTSNRDWVPDPGPPLEADTVLATSSRLTSRAATSAPHPDARAMAGASMTLSVMRPEERSLVALADGHRTVAEIVRQSGLPDLTAIHVLRLLCGRGILVAVDPTHPASGQPGVPRSSTRPRVQGAAPRPAVVVSRPVVVGRPAVVATAVSPAAAAPAAAAPPSYFDYVASESSGRDDLDLPVGRIPDPGAHLGGGALGSPFRVGAYEVAIRLGQGGMASTYLCRRAGELGTQGRFTLKVVRQHGREMKAALESFNREARMGGLLAHPNIQRVLDTGTYKGQPFLVLDYVDGVSLVDLTAGGNRVPAPIAVLLVLDLLHALEHIHGLVDEQGIPAGLVHGDVSPQNLLIGADGGARLTDFGNARFSAEAMSSEMPTFGKPSYMAPEQLRGERQDHRTDIFAAGLMMWELLTGQSLFGAPSYDETVLKVFRRRIPAPSTLGAPAPLDDVCLRALCRAPDGRFASAAEMAQLLSEVATAQGLLATRDDVARWMLQQAGETLADRRRRANAVFSKPVSTAVPEPAQFSAAATVMIADPFAAARARDDHAVSRPAEPTVIMSAIGPNRGERTRPASREKDDKPARNKARAMVLAAAGTVLVASLSYWLYAGHSRGPATANAQHARHPTAGATAVAEPGPEPQPKAGESRPNESKQMEAKR